MEGLGAGTFSSLNVGDDDQGSPNNEYDEDALTAWDEELLDSLDKVVEAFSSKANLDAGIGRRNLW